jgi:glycerol-3-phosphate dehydrogenase
VPWPHFWLVGTTDAPYSGPIDRPTAGPDEVDELLAAVNHVLDVDLRREDVVGTYAGLRPLIAPSDGSTVTASREHRVVVERNGLVRVSGGKYTTYRLMAEQTIDAALGVLGERPATRAGRTTTRRLVGAADRPELDRVAARVASSAALEPAIAARLVARHGTQAPDVVALGREMGLLGRLVDGEDHLEVEVAWAARRELALSIDDVLARRMRIVHELPDRAAGIAPRVAAILGRELGWDAARQSVEVDMFLAGARREFAIP